MKRNLRPVVRRSVAAALLRVSTRTLDKLKLHCWREGRVTLYDPVQIAGLMALRDVWLSSRRRANYRRAFGIVVREAAR